MAQQKKKNQAGVAVAVWILIALVLLIIFLVKQDDIMKVLKDTGFFKHTIGTEPEFISNYEPEPKPEQGDSAVEIVVQTEPPPAQEELSPPQVQTNPLPDEAEQEALSRTENGRAQDASSSAAEVSEVAALLDDKPAIPTTNVKLYFVSIGGDGSIAREQVTRSLQKTNSPLTAALNALLEGPALDELDSGCMTLIPEGSRLLSATVKDKVATLNFSEEFEFNRYGVEGYIGQLMQVVYTATAFPTVESVQFLVEGQRKEYIGSEGVWIGSPLSTSSFK